MVSRTGLSRGIIKDVMDGLAAAGGTPGIETIYLCGRRDLDIPVIPYESEILKDLIFDLVDQAAWSCSFIPGSSARR